MKTIDVDGLNTVTGGLTWEECVANARRNHSFADENRCNANLKHWRHSPGSRSVPPSR